MTVDELANELSGCERGYAVVHETRGIVRVLPTMQDAVNYIGGLPDQDDVYQGRYTIDGPCEE